MSGAWDGRCMRCYRSEGMNKRARIAFVAALVVAGAAALLLIAPIPQPQGYHDFADQRTLFAIPRFFDVVSNAPFFILGTLALWLLAAGRIRFVDPRERGPYAVFFLGILLTAITSAWYHLAPDDARLAGDRLTMTVAFMGWLAAQIAERLGVRAGLLLLPVLLALGMGSVLYWAATEAAGRGDLRFYGFVQFYPALLIPLLLGLFPPRYSRGGDVLAVLGLYALALTAEWFDRPLFEMTGVISGHTLKHLIAALAVYWMLRMLHLRWPVSPAQTSPAKPEASSTTASYSP